MQNCFLIERKKFLMILGVVYWLIQKNFNSWASNISTNNRGSIKYTSLQCINETINTKIINFFNKSSNRKMDPRKRTQNNTSEQLLQLLRFPRLLAQEPTGNISENLLMEIWQIVYSLYRAKQISNQVFNYLIKS